MLLILSHSWHKSDSSRPSRFEENNFGQWSRGFYASVPIQAPAPFGDFSTPSYPCGIFCILDSKPRSEFTIEEGHALALLADEAGAEIARHQAARQKGKKQVLVTKREEWKRRKKVVKKIAVKSPLDTVVEINTPPDSPELGSTGSVSPTLSETRRPSLARTLTSESATSVIITTDVTPTFCKRTSGQIGLHASAALRIAPEIKSMLDLSTRVIGESLELDFCYILAIDLPSLNNRSAPTTSKQVRLLSAHNVPIPAPLFDIQLQCVPLFSGTLLPPDPDSFLLLQHRDPRVLPQRPPVYRPRLLRRRGRVLHRPPRQDRRRGRYRIRPGRVRRVEAEGPRPPGLPLLP